MDVIKNKKEERARKIAEIQESIKKAMKHKTISYDGVVIAAMSNLMISRRIAQEYVDVVLFRLGMNRTDLMMGKFKKDYNAAIKKKDFPITKR